MKPTAFGEGDVRAIARDMADLEGPLLPILHAVQERFGLIDEAAMRAISEELNLSRAEVHGVVSFYHDFHQEPRARHVLKACRAEACQARGSEVLAAVFERETGLAFGETSRDGQVALEACYCLGLCAIGPAAMLDGRLAARLDAAKVAALVAEARL